MRRSWLAFPSLLPFFAAAAACADNGTAPIDENFVDAATNPDGATSHPDGGGPGADGALPGNDGALPGNDGSPAGCGTCPTGYTCGSANGIAVCRSADGIPLFTHVFVILMENTSLSTLSAATNTPNLAAMKTKYATGSDYHGVAHPSLPNYVALVSGGTQSIACDCDPTGTACTSSTCNIFSSTCACDQPTTVKHVGDQIETAGKAWMAYAENMGTACNTTSTSPYATKHVPFLYFDDVVKDTTRCPAHVVDYTGFNPDTAPDFSFITPNLTDDMHDPVLGGATNLANGDMWIGPVVDKITKSASYTSGGLLVVVWDEDDNSGIPTADAPVPIFVMSPYAKSGGYMSATHGDHYALLRTFEEGLGISTYLGMASSATALSDYFPAQ
jgi:hypothetical protein